MDVAARHRPGGWYQLLNGTQGDARSAGLGRMFFRRQGQHREGEITGVEHRGWIRQGNPGGVDRCELIAELDVTPRAHRDVPGAGADDFEAGAAVRGGGRNPDGIGGLTVAADRGGRASGGPVGHGRIELADDHRALQWLAQIEIPGWQHFAEVARVGVGPGGEPIGPGLGVGRQEVGDRSQLGQPHQRVAAVGEILVRALGDGNETIAQRVVENQVAGRTQSEDAGGAAGAVAESG